MATFETGMYRQNPLRTVAEYENDLLRNDSLRGLNQRNQLLMQREQEDQAMQRDLHGMKMRAEPELRAARQAEVGKANIDNIAKAAKFISFAVSQASGPDQVAEVFSNMAQNPDLAPVFGLMEGGYDGAIQRLRESSGTPQAFAEYQLKTQNGVESLLPKIYNYSTGAHQVTTGVHPQTGKPIFTNAHEISQSPNSEATERVAGVRNDIAAAKLADTAAPDNSKELENLDRKVTKYSETLQKHGIPEFEDSLKNLEGVFNEYKKGEVPGVGKAVGLVPAWLQGQEAERVNQAIAEVKNVLLKARSGAAVTDSELKRFVEELGTGGLRSEATVRLAIDRIRKRFDKVKTNAVAGVSDDVKATYEDRGGTVIPRAIPVDAAPVAPPVQTGPYGDAEKERRYQEWKAKQK